MWKWIRQFRALKPPARELFLRASVLLPLVSATLPWRGFRKTKASLEHFLPAVCGSESPDAQPRAALVAEMVRAAAHYGIGRPSCLEQSLVLWWLLARRGIASDLRVGVRKHEENFEAHAWVECGGTILSDLEAEHRHFAAFDAALASLPPGPWRDGKVTD